MASLGHVAIGMAAARRHEHRVPAWGSLAVWSVLSMLPDADVIGFSLGVEYGDPWGHRGATHSFAFALVVGSAVALVAARRRFRAFWRTALFACGVLATHPLLDTMTDGGLGCALFWPFDLTRYFAPWRPIQVAPIGLAFFTPEGALIALSEIILFLPLFVFALRRTQTRAAPLTAGAALAAWLAASWLMASSDPLREATVGWILRDSTLSAPGFSEARFASIADGVTEADVHARLGAPLEVSWFFPRSSNGGEPCGAVRLRDGIVVEAFPPEGCDARGIRAGTPRDAVERELGPHIDECWSYTKGAPQRAFRLRVVCFRNARVEMLGRRWIFQGPPE
jgi:inner membrane protein